MDFLADPDFHEHRSAVCFMWSKSLVHVKGRIAEAILLMHSTIGLVLLGPVDSAVPAIFVTAEIVAT